MYINYTSVKKTTAYISAFDGSSVEVWETIKEQGSTAADQTP